jgi:hypothetical protein
MTPQKEIEMEINEKIRSDNSSEIVELGVASSETKGAPPAGNEGMGHQSLPGITE